MFLTGKLVTFLSYRDRPLVGIHGYFWLLSKYILTFGLKRYQSITAHTPKPVTETGTVRNPTMSKGKNRMPMTPNLGRPMGTRSIKVMAANQKIPKMDQPTLDAHPISRHVL